MRSSLAAAFVFLCAMTASAGTITSIDPSTVKVNSGEHFVTVYGSSLGDLLIFDGPAGHFEVQANAVFSGSTVGWVPEAIVRKSGVYGLKVRNNGVDSNTVNFTVQGFKIFPLVILLPESLIVQPRTREGAFVKFEVIAIGGDDPNPRVSCDHDSGELFPMGVTKVTCTATNSFGEKATDSFNISVLDREGPRVTVPSEPIVVKAQSREGAVVEFKTSAFDDIYGDTPTDCLPRSGSNFPIGITNVTCTATDVDLNIGFGTFTVEVLGDVKWYPLTVHVPEGGVIVEAVDPNGAVVKYEVKVSGTEDPAPELTCDPKSGSQFPIGTTIVLCTAIDRWGMRGSGDFSVSVYDPAPPQIERVTATPDKLPFDRRLYPITIEVSAFDKIDLRPTCSVFDVSSIEDIHLGDDDDPKAYDWKITGQFTLELRGDRDGKGTRIYDVWVSCTDFFGNESRASVPVFVSGEGGLSAPVTEPAKRRAVGRR